MKKKPFQHLPICPSPQQLIVQINCGHIALLYFGQSSLGVVVSKLQLLQSTVFITEGTKPQLLYIHCGRAGR
jgi:hypothetical protein